MLSHAGCSRIIHPYLINEWFVDCKIELKAQTIFSYSDWIATLEPFYHRSAACVLPA